MDIIFDKYFVSKSDGATKYQITSIRNICKRIACNLSTTQNPMNQKPWTNIHL